jgi:hypothetical protein
VKEWKHQIATFSQEIENGSIFMPDERIDEKMIFNAMSSELGPANNRQSGMGNYWYTCPNGHIYTIGDCGGAMIEAKCPECGSTIGGANHRSAMGNEAATAFLDRVNAPRD